MPNTKPAYYPPHLNKEKPEAVAPQEPSHLEDQIKKLETELEDIAELLHLWVNEAHAYRTLSESVATGQLSPSQVKHVLQKAIPDSMSASHLILTKGEHEAFITIATFAQLDPRHFLWSCLDTIMNHCDDEDVLAGCAEAANKRFHLNQHPQWAVHR